MGVIAGLGPSLIVHAGDVGGEDVLIELEATAPVVAVRGNTDHGPGASALPSSASVTIGEHRLTVVHDVSGFSAPRDSTIVVSGHTHVPSISYRGRALYLNPGSVTRPRGQTGIPTLAVLDLGEGPPVARIVSV